MRCQALVEVTNVKAVKVVPVALVNLKLVVEALVLVTLLTKRSDPVAVVKLRLVVKRLVLVTLAILASEPVATLKLRLVGLRLVIPRVVPVAVVKFR